MSQPAPTPSALDEAAESYWDRRSLDGVLAGVQTWHSDESFEIADLTDYEWEAFVRAIHE